MPSVAEFITRAKSEFPEWLDKQNEVVIPRSMRVLKLFNEGDAAMKNSVGDYSSFIAHFRLKTFVLENLGDPGDCDDFAISAELGKRPFFYAIAILPENTNAAIGFSDYAENLARLIVAGWKDEAELTARLGFAQLQMHDIQRGKFKGGALAQGQSLCRFPYFLMDLMKDWLGADVSTVTPFRREVISDLGGWQEILDNWREPDTARFAQVLARAADYYVDQSRYMIEEGNDENPDYRLEHYEIEKDAYWVFPVLLLGVLRLREWEGLPNPRVEHDLFQQSPLARLPEPLPRPKDEFFDAVDKRFRALCPNTPSLNDLPTLRTEQGGRAA